jgi:cytochrome c-type biogenesis protein CcmH
MTWFFVATGLMAAFAFGAVLVPLAGKSRWRSAVPVAASAPLVAAGLYAALGTPAALLPTQQALETAAPPQVEAMVARLAARLKEQPRDADGWRLMARSYETLRRFDQAAGAYRQLLSLEGESADLLADYAVVLGMANGERLSGEPEKLLQRALELNSQHVQVLALLGSAALERHDRASALNAWKKVLALAPAGSGMARSIQASIARVEAEAAQ